MLTAGPEENERALSRQANPTLAQYPLISSLSARNSRKSDFELLPGFFNRYSASMARCCRNSYKSHSTKRSCRCAEVIVIPIPDKSWFFFQVIVTVGGRNILIICASKQSRLQLTVRCYIRHPTKISTAKNIAVLAAINVRLFLEQMDCRLEDLKSGLFSYIIVHEQ